MGPPLQQAAEWAGIQSSTTRGSDGTSESCGEDPKDHKWL